MPSLHAASATLAKQLAFARAESDRLFDVLTPEAIYHRPISQRHRVVFYIGHLDGFDSIQICREGLGLKSPDPQLDDLFQAGIDPDSAHLPSDQPADWPSIDRVRAYVDECRKHVDQHLEVAPEDTVFMALEHRQMHLETLAYMFHNFSYDKKISAAADRPVANGNPPEPSWCAIPAGEAILGKDEDGSFGWDNEYCQHRVYVPEFRIQKYSVTNGQYLEYVEAGASAPNFWLEREGSYFYRGMFGEMPLPLDWPVYVSQQEAQAYAASLGKQLPTEEQFHRAAYGTRSGRTRPFPWGEDEPDSAHGNFDFRRWDPEPVTASPAGDSDFGVSQLAGNGWQWTSTLFAPFEGFKARSTYPGYSSNFFDGQHYVMKGGSPRTAARLLRPSFRNWFRPDYPYVYATFRCVEN